MSESKQIPLHDIHVAQGAKMTPFAGFNMPVWYTNLKEEHMAVRQDAGIFDVSHMGVLKILGTGAEALLQQLNCNDVTKAKSHQMVYSMILNHEGGVLDDVMVGSLSDTDWLMVVNASNAQKILDWMATHDLSDVTIENRTSTHGFFALQGPNAVKKASALLDLSLEDLPRFGILEASLFGADVLITRTGYTGEDGIEISAPVSVLETLWTTVVGGGFQPCGLGARDSLRIEAGLPLYGQELSETITPVMTRYHRWVVKWETEFNGKTALEARRQDDEAWTTVGLEMQDRFIPRTGYPVDGGGQITSGTLSPSLGKPVAMAMVKKDAAVVGETLKVEIRGRLFDGKVVKLPFITSG